MERYGTDHEVEEDGTALVYTHPKKVSRVYRYPFHSHRGVWVLSRERDWYTEHALTYAEDHLDGKVLRRQVSPAQTTIDDFHGGGVQSETPSAPRCEGD